MEFTRGCAREGWWAGARESDEMYITRVEGVVKWLWTLQKNTLLITHGKFIDTTMKALFHLPNVIDETVKSAGSVSGGLGGASYGAFSNISSPVFLHGGCSLTCIELDKSTGRVGVHYMNIPIITDARLRTGHKNSGFQYVADPAAPPGFESQLVTHKG